MTATPVENSKVFDVQYVKNYDEQIGALYEEAKASYIDAPIQTLVSLRSIVHELCKQLHREYFLKSDDDLYSMINALRSEKVVNRNVIDFMYAIKRPGDKAAHKHQYEITMGQYRDMSADSVQKFCRLIEMLNSALRSDFSTYVFEPKVASYLDKLTYKAVFDNEAEAKFKVGLALIEQVITNWNGPNPSITDGGKIHRGIKWIEEAADEKHLEAKFEYGMMLSIGKYVEKNIDKAIGHLYHAAEMQHVGAKAGFASIVFEENITEEVQLAIDYLKEASDASYPFALTMLSDLYANGKYVEHDAEMSNQLLQKAVKQDYPPALYRDAYKKIDENGTDLSIKLFNKSKALGDFHSSLMLAKIYISLGEDHYQQASLEYRHYLDFCDITSLEYLETCLEYESLKYEIGEHDFKLLQTYLQALVGIYQNEKCSENLMAIIGSITPPLIKAYYSEVKGNNNRDDMFLVMNFLPNGKPYKTKAEVFDNISKIADTPSLAVSCVYGVDPLRVKQQAKIGKAQNIKQQESLKRQKNKAKTRKTNKGKRKQKG